VAQRVGDGFLDAAEERVRGLCPMACDAGLDAQVDLQGRQPRAQHAQRLREVDCAVVTGACHDAANLRQQIVADVTRGRECRRRGAAGLAQGQVKMQVQRGQVMTDHVVQVTCDAQPLAAADGIGQQRLGGQYLGMGHGQCLARLALMQHQAAQSKTDHGNGALGPDVGQQ